MECRIEAEDIIKTYPWVCSLETTQVENFIAEAYQEFCTDTYREHIHRLVQLYVAHKSHIEIQNNLAVNSAMASIQAEKTVHATINFNSDKNKIQNYWELSSYGQELLQLKNKIMVTHRGMFVV